MEGENAAQEVVADKLRDVFVDRFVRFEPDQIGRNAQLTNCVLDRGVIIPEGLVVGEEEVADKKWFNRTDAGITLITQDMLDARAAALG